MTSDRKRRYTADQKAAALEAVGMLGLADAVRATGIPKRTLADWAKAAGLRTGDTSKTEAARAVLAAKVAEEREALRLALLRRAANLERRMDDEHIEFLGSKEGPHQVTYPTARSGDVRNYSISIGILVDKFRLESGEHTTQVKHESDEVRHDVEKRVDELSERRTRKTG